MWPRPSGAPSAIAALSLFLYGGFATGPAVGEWLIDHGGFDLAWRSVAALGAVGLGAVLLLPETGRGIMAVRAELGPYAAASSCTRRPSGPASC